MIEFLSHLSFQSVHNLIVSILPEDKKGAAIELTPYLLDAFGNPTRIDYGSGETKWDEHF